MARTSDEGSRAGAGPVRDRAFDAIVLAGGGARRLGGADKAEVVVGGIRMLDRVLDALRDATRTIVVGPYRVTNRPVLWTRETPAGGGPVAAIDAGMSLVEAGTVVIAAVDHPFFAPSTVRRLIGSLDTGDGAIVSDLEGRDQPLVGAYRADRMRDALGSLDGTDGASVRSLVRDLSLAHVPDRNASADCDTWSDVAAAHRLAALTDRGVDPRPRP